jgi:hypothetical protein
MVVVVPSVGAFNSYLAGLKYEIGNSWANNNPQMPVIRPLDDDPLTSSTSSPSTLMMDSSSTTEASSFILDPTEDYVLNTLPLLLEDSLPEMLVPTADNSLLTTASDADLLDESSVQLDECGSAYADSSLYGVQFPVEMKNYEPGPVIDINMSDQHQLSLPQPHHATSMPITKAKSYSVFGKRPRPPASAASSSVSSSYLDGVSKTEGGFLFSAAEYVIVPSNSTSSYPDLKVDMSQSEIVESQSAQFDNLGQLKPAVTSLSTSKPKLGSYLGYGTKPKLVASGTQFASSGYISALSSANAGFGVNPEVVAEFPLQVGGDSKEWIERRDVGYSCPDEPDISSSASKLTFLEPLQDNGREVIASKSNTKSSFSGFGVKPKKVPDTVNSWMSWSTTRSSPASSFEASPTTSSEPASSVTDMHVSTSSASDTESVKKPSYSGFGVKARAVESRDANSPGYLLGLAAIVSASETESKSRDDAAESLFVEPFPTWDPVDAPVQKTSVNASPVRRPSYSGFGVKHKAPETARTTIKQSEIESQSDVSNVNSSVFAKTSYTGFGVKHKASMTLSQAVQSNVKATNIVSDADPSIPSKSSLTGFGGEPKDPETRIQSAWTADLSSVEFQGVTAAIDYMGRVTSSSESFPKKGLYSGFGVKPAVQKSGNSYLDNLASADAISTSLNVDERASMKNEVELEQSGNEEVLLMNTEEGNTAEKNPRTVNVGRLLHPVTSVESSWVSGKSLSECSATSASPASPNHPSRLASDAASPPNEGTKSLPLIHPYSPTQWTLNRQSSIAESVPTSSNSKIFTGAIIEPIDSTLKEVDFPPPADGPAAGPSSYLSGLASGSDSSLTTVVKKPSYSGFGVIHKDPAVTKTATTTDPSSSVSVVKPELITVSEEVSLDQSSSCASNESSPSVQIGSGTSYLDSFPGSVPPP